MRGTFLIFTGTAAILASLGFAQQSPADGPYKVLKTVKAGGEGGFDYVYADSDERRLYVARSGPAKRISVFNLDTLEPAGEIPDVSAHGAAVDPKSRHGFATSKPVVMWDTKTLKTIKTIDVQGNPDGLLFDPYNQRVYILSHAAPNATVIDSKDGAVLGTIDLGGAPEQAVTDGKGKIYIDIEDKDNIAVVDAKTMQVTAHYSLGENKTPAGLAFDAKNHILFVECRNPAVSVIMNALDGKIITTLPIGSGVDGGGFNPKTMEAFSSQGDGTLTVIKEKSPATFEVEQTVKTMPSAKTMTIDTRTNHILLIGAEFGPAPADGKSRRGPLVPDSFTILEVGK
ncbi:MAG: YncE family protein [Acidobacteriota bacterium]|nr:YncE family protein [Acidobacteriota bacterium]